MNGNFPKEINNQASDILAARRAAEEERLKRALDVVSDQSETYTAEPALISRLGHEGMKNANRFPERAVGEASSLVDAVAAPMLAIVPLYDMDKTVVHQTAAAEALELAEAAPSPQEIVTTYVPGARLPA